MSKEDIFKVVTQHCREVVLDLEGHEFRSEERLSELGANSIDRAEIIAMTMETLDLNIPRVELFGATNIGELVNVLYEKLQ